MIISDLILEKRRGCIPGTCANPDCGVTVYESEALLSDAYNVWMGRCPKCKALNYLGMTGLRGYSSQGMDLVLPTDEEKIANDLPPDTLTSGACGTPAEWHGSNAGEILHQLRKG